MVIALFLLKFNFLIQIVFLFLFFSITFTFTINPISNIQGNLYQMFILVEHNFVFKILVNVDKTDLFNLFSLSENKVLHHMRLAPDAVSLCTSRVGADGARKTPARKEFFIYMEHYLNTMSNACCCFCNWNPGSLDFSFPSPVLFCIKHMLIEVILKIHLYSEVIGYIMLLKYFSVIVILTYPIMSVFIREYEEIWKHKSSFYFFPTIYLHVKFTTTYLNLAFSP